MRLGSMTLSLHPFSAARWVAAPQAPTPTPATQAVFGRYYTLPPADSKQPPSAPQCAIPSPQAEAHARKAHELIESMQHRYIQLSRFLQAYNAFKANPLGGPMCAEMEEKIHQLALLLRTQQQQLKRIVGSYEDVAEEEEAAEAPVTDWLATIRVAVLREVVDFSTNELKRIEQSALLARYPRSSPKLARQPSF
ncbi:hypothetical protein GGI25_001098 [Coemansia spiralis]|uniref:Uncharacterized protein n=2 Tax=Coemansia TaxID=4863 RepID=A0A9W8GB38_9FUNG|nr:hypothetical protein EDC05_000768 [Coemansia umbellata]KAJ2625138.1 hypothetical protein GGI26_000941 [Coemansia sp. RSA 1358]KAJ2679909.1 hypothetical protein GGI25_001098 [Coemansia spiralis]